MPKAATHSRAASNKKFWSVKAENTQGGSEGHLYLYGDISSQTWWGDEVTPRQFQHDLDALGDIDVLNVHIFSNGGDFFAGNAIYAILKRQRATINVYIEGIAASIATAIAMAGDKIFIASTAMMMVHNVMVGLCDYFNAGELQAILSDLEKYREPLIATYSNRTGQTRAEVITMLDGEDGRGTWYDAEAAIAAGLADEYIPGEIEQALPIAARIKPHVYEWNGYTFDLSGYPIPQNLDIATKHTSTTTPKAKGRHKAMKQNRKAKNARRGGVFGKILKTANLVKNEILSVTCPDCGATFDVEYEPSGEGDVLTIECPECGATFEHVVEAPQDDDGEGESAQAKVRRTQNRKWQGVKNELETITCPECGATFEYGYEIPEGDDVDTLSVVCPDCGETFLINPDTGAESDPEDLTTLNRGGYSGGVQAERNRIIQLDTIAKASPDFAHIVDKGKAEGWTYAKTAQRVFAAMNAKAQTTGKNGYLNHRQKETQAANAVKAAPHAGARSAGSNDAAIAKTASLIVQGSSRKKEDK